MKRLIDLASLVIIDAPSLSKGTRFELECCSKEQALHKTVVILSPPNILTGEKKPFPSNDSDPLVQRFPRVVWSDDLRDDIASRVPIRDLVNRAFDIAALSADSRTELVKNGKLSVLHPITYEDVARTYIAEATARLGTRRPGHSDPWQDNWERTFWGFHRAVLTMHAMINLFIVRPEDLVRELVVCYRTMVNLLAEANISTQGVATRGDLKLCVRLSEEAIKVAELSEGPPTLQTCEEMLKEASRRVALIKSDYIPYRANLKTLYLASLGELVTA